MKILLELPGIGEAMYLYNGDALLIQIPNMPDVILQGQEARMVFTRIQKQVPQTDIGTAFKIARDITGIQDLTKRTRQTHYVYARWIFWDYLVIQKAYTQSLAAKLIGFKHTTVCHGISAFSTPAKFLPTLEKSFKEKYENYLQGIK